MVVISTGYTYTCGQNSGNPRVTVDRQIQVLRAPISETTTTWPGEVLEIKIPEEFLSSCEEVFSFKLIEGNQEQQWIGPALSNNVAGCIQIANLTSEPKTTKRNHGNVRLGMDRETLAPDVKSDSEVFNPWFKETNEAAGPFKFTVNMGPV